MTATFMPRLDPLQQGWISIDDIAATLAIGGKAIKRSSLFKLITNMCSRLYL